MYDLVLYTAHSNLLFHQFKGVVMPVSFEPLKKSALWTLSNKVASVDIEKKTGFIRGCRWRGTDIDLFEQVRGGIPGYIGGLRIYDERDRKWYSDYETPFTVSKATMKGKKVSLLKQFKGAPFRIEVIFEMGKDGLRWEVNAEKTKAKVADRSLRIYFNTPLIAGWDVWAPCYFGEVTFDGMTPFEFMYTQIPYVSKQEIVLPMTSHFNRNLDVGYSVVLPIDANVPAAKFAFNNAEKCFNWGSMHKNPADVPVLETITYYIGLVGNRPMHTEAMLLFHEGDWRPGLGTVYRRWKPFFDPFNDAIYDREGVFICGGVQNADNVKQLVDHGVKTMEVHGHFNDYCDYYQDGKDRWLKIGHKEGLRRKLMEKEGKDSRAKGAARHQAEKATSIEEQVENYLDSHSDQELAEFLGVPKKELFHTRKDIKRRLQKLTDAGIDCHWYFNYTDGYRPRVEKEWPDSISRDEDGNPIPSGWYMCHNMNADPRWSFGKFTYDSAQKIFDEYPMLKGFFLDCFRHYEIDFAHDDGVTVVNGKPAYSMNHSYDDIERLIKTKIMKPRNLTAFANKPMSIRSMRYCDGQLLEGDGDQYEEKFFWACIAMPMFFMWTRTTFELEECLRRAVLHGCFPRNPGKFTRQTAKLYQRYLPLYREFHRRVLCFEPDPMRAPEGSRGKFYTVPDGYIASVVNLSIHDEDKHIYGKKNYALFRVERGHDVSKVGVMLPGDKEMQSVPFKFDGTFIAVPLDRYKNCAVIKLFVTEKTGKKIGKDTFAQRPRMCGDPDSAFEDISVR